MTSSRYIGRFAPSPTGKLHFGSLTSAVASYLDAKAHGGQWLVRMEDLDPPREEAGAAASILESLEAHHLYWDGPVLYQSTRLDAYAEIADKLQPLTYPCRCIRQRLIGLNGPYDSHCRYSPPAATDTTAQRIRIDALADNLALIETTPDLFQGPQTFPLADVGDFIIRRKDGLFAYQLAVAVDDHYQGVTHVIRGLDLLDSTSRQRYILRLLDAPLPEYGHLPLALGADGDKLSKQTRAQPLDNRQNFSNLIAALRFLGHPPPQDCLSESNCEQTLQWAVQHWQRSRVPRQSTVAPPLASG